MIEFIYDNTFEGLLTAIFYAYPKKEPCIITRKSHYIPSLLNETIEINGEDDKFNRVYNSILEKLNNQVLKNIYYLYLSEISNIEKTILQYIKLCYKYGVNINLAKNNDVIIAVDKYCRRVTLESHRFTGFVRFKEISYLTFYAAIEPDYNILPIIMPHFKERFSDQNFIIHDINREIAIIYNTKSYFITALSTEDGKKLSDCKDDSIFEDLWKTFYNSVNIDERQNIRQRNQYMPKRYWSHLTEI